MTIQQALDVHDRSVSSRDAEVLLQKALECEREFLHAHPDHELSPQQEKTYISFLDRRETNEPVAYITGRKEFFGRLFGTDKRALIPRPETELLVDRALELLPDRFWTHTKATNKPCPIRILEIGTGAGNIAITLSLELAARTIPAEIIATDISEEALALAQENFTTLSNTQAHSPIRWLVADMFDYEAIAAKKPYDLIIANLPYVPTSWKLEPAAQADVIFYEPEVALFGGADGLDLYRRFFADLPKFLMDDGIVLVEYGEDETGNISGLAADVLPNLTLAVHKDYADLERMLELS